MISQAKATRDERGCVIIGYSTEFEGRINLSRPLTGDEVTGLEVFLSQRHEDGEYPSIWCDWELTEDKAGLQSSGGEKEYAMDEWLVYLANGRLANYGVTLAGGEVYAQGEVSSDRWILRIEDGRVVRYDSVFVPAPATRRVVA